MSPQTDPKTSNLRREFGFLWAVLGVSLLTVLLLFAYSRLFLAPSFTALIAHDTEDTAILVGTHIKDDLFRDEEPFARETLPPGLGDELTEFTHNFHLVKIKVFAPNGETVFSTEAKDIGVMNEHDYFRQVVAQGRPFSKIVLKDSPSLEGQRVAADVVETYVPAMRADGAFLGAFEIYLDITATKDKLDRLVTHANRTLYTVSAALLLVILFIAIRARANILARRQADAKVIQQSAVLEETNRDLSIVNEISAVISHFIDLDRLLPAILDTIASRFAAFSRISRGGIFLLAGDKLLLSAHLGHDEEFLRQHQGITVQDCLCGQAARTGQIVLSENSALDHQHTLCCETLPHGHAIIPLMAHDTVLGVLYLYTEVGVHLSDKEDLLRSIGLQLGLAINNATLYQQSKRLALFDQLTDLPNRRSMDARLTEAVTAAERYHRHLSVAMIDIDYFKKYNDSMGHAAGDRVLAAVAAIIRQEIREADFVARYGGEEFLLIMTETEPCGACIGVERLRRIIEQQAGVTISVGVTAYRPEMTGAQLLSEADDALYRAKTNGRNRVEWSDSIAPCHEMPAR